MVLLLGFKMKTTLIASCGMNCMICKGYLRDKNKCPGCKKIDKNNPKYCRKCIIKNCDILKKKNMKFCSEKCEKFPCKRLRDLDKRYKTKHGMSMMDNLNTISKKGIKEFLKQQKKKYQKGNDILCVHDKEIYKIK